MRIWLKPDRLAAYGLSPQEVTGAIREQSLEAAPGRLGEASKEVFEYVLKYKGKLTQNKEYEDIIIKANSDGSVIRLKDVARVEFGSYTYSSNGKLDGYPSSGVAVFQTAGTNANDILIQAEKLMAMISPKHCPKGLKNDHHVQLEGLPGRIDQPGSFDAFGSIHPCIYRCHLYSCKISVLTLIPAIAVPVAIVGTFFFMQLFGFTINFLTLFALVLAIGIVVDDAIVVVEAVHSKMERSSLGAKPATIESMNGDFRRDHFNHSGNGRGIRTGRFHAGTSGGILTGSLHLH